LAIGWWSLRRTRSPRDFFIAGQNVGLWVTAMATMSAAFSGFIFIGGPGLTQRLGVSSFFISVPLGFTAAMLCWTLAKPLRLLAEIREVYTVPDAVFWRYGSRRASGAAAIAVVVGSIAYLGAQLLALGLLIESIFGTREWLGMASRPLATLCGLVIVLTYSVAGGMIAGVYTDFVQGVIMTVAAVFVFFFALDAGGGLRTMVETIATSEGAAFVDPLGGVPLVTALGFFFVFGIGTLGQPHMLHKLYMLDDPRKIRWMPLLFGGSQVLCVLIWLGIGLAVPTLIANGELAPLANPDDAAPAFLLNAVPDVLAGLVFAGLLAAIMSTADSFVNVASAALVRDLPRALGRPLRDELFWGRVAVAAIAVAATLLAWVWGDLIALLGTFAFGIFGAALTPALAIGLNWPRATPAAATASILTGVGLTLVLEFLAKQTFLPGLPKPDFLVAGFLPSAVSLAVSFVVFFVVSWLTSARVIDRDVEMVMEI
ncbi:MAG: sodium/proline symporter, partial [Acidobacteriota bacterium]